MQKEEDVHELKPNQGIGGVISGRNRFGFDCPLRLSFLVILCILDLVIHVSHSLLLILREIDKKLSQFFCVV